ncbi:MAG: hypothetical protein CFE38_05500 [Comamonadaceae bacterium PBBC1]|nr:MAG: hypothetical protein CFE38_05500 [Comamonadaceae bacterium PBBC1]
MRTIEIRTYRLKPGTSAQFEVAMQNALPMVRAAVDVVAFGRADSKVKCNTLFSVDESGVLRTVQEQFPVNRQR